MSKTVELEKALDLFMEETVYTRTAIHSRLNELEDASQWIDAKHKLPEINLPVLAYMPKYGDPNIQVIWLHDYTEGKTWFNVHWKTYQLDEVTHWQTLPSPPIK